MGSEKQIVTASKTDITSGEFVDVVFAGDTEIAKATRHFLTTKVANPHSRDNYTRSVRDFLGSCFAAGLAIDQVDTEVLGHYRDHLMERHDISTVNNKLSGISKFYRTLIQENLLRVNPGDKLERPRLERETGTTPEIPVKDARKLLDSITGTDVVSLRDKALLGVLAFTALRVGAEANIRLCNFQNDGDQYVLLVTEKRGKKRKVPVRHDLQEWILDYVYAAGLSQEPDGWHLFRAAKGKTKTLKPYAPENPDAGTKVSGAMTSTHIHRMLKRRLKNAGLPTHYSCHSFRVAIATDLFRQGVDGDDVQYLLGHKDRRTTALYNRKEKKVTRNLVERISI